MTDRSTSSHQRRQSYEKLDGCVDEVNEMGFFHSTSSKPIEESDSQIMIPSKRSA